MVEKSVPGTSLTYELVSMEADGKFRDQEDVRALAERLKAEAADITDVYFLIHGWNTQLEDSERSYELWLSKVAEAFGPGGVPASVRFVGVHWPSKAWGDETDVAGGNVLGSPNGPTITPEKAKAEYAELLGIPESAALDRIVDAAAQNYDRVLLSPELREAFEKVRDAMDVDPIEDGQPDEPDWDPAQAWDEMKKFDLEELGLDASAGATGVLGGGGGGRVLGLLRQLSFWRMKKRARIVGESGAAELLDRVIAAAPDARISLMGHSMGAIVACAAVARSDRVSTANPVQSMLLVQGAFSMWAFDDSIPVAHGAPGYFHEIIAQRLVAGPILVTRSVHDHAVGTYYPLAARFGGSVVLARTTKYGAIGAYGAVGLDNEATDLTLHKGGGSDRLNPHHLYNIEASEVICKMKPVEGAHNDIAHIELARLGITAAQV